MQSEDFDDKVKNAAEHHHPAYDEKAWDKMQQLLDEHLPVEKDDRRKPLLFILLFLLLGSGAWLIATKPWQKNKTAVTAKQESSIPAQHAVAPETNNTSDNNNKETGQTISEDKTTAIIETKTEAAADKIISTTNNTKPVVSLSSKELNEKKIKSPVPTIKKDKESSPLFAARNKKGNSNPGGLKITANNISQKDKTINKQHPQTTADDKTNNDNNQIAVVSGITNPVANNGNDAAAKRNTIADDKIINVQDKSKKVTEEIKKDEPVANKPEAKKIAKNKKNSSFFFSLSAGPDVSFAGSGNAGTTKLLTGAGLGYTFNNKLTIRTGFYSSRKIYSSGPDEYHPPKDFYAYYPYLQKVNANCKVYEIPLLVSYSFGKSSKHNFFASTGLSSYLMKSEVYDYSYKTSYTSPVMKGKWTVDNENKHFFSVLSLSGGYQRNINKNISLIVEPYLKLPLSGVGYGKVKLNSAGVLFTVGIKPFNTSSKKQQH